MLRRLDEQRHDQHDGQRAKDRGGDALRLVGALAPGHVQPEHRIRRAHEQADARGDELEIGEGAKQVGAAENQ